MKLSIQAASTSQTVNIFVRDSSSTVGAGLTGLVFNTASLTAYYALPKAAAVAITLVTQTVTGAFSSGGFVEISSANMPGWYRLDIPNAALASGRFVNLHLKGATNMAALPVEIELTGWDNQDSVRGGLTALPNATAGGTFGLPLAVDGSGRVDVLKINGTSQTARDLGASVLLSVGLGAGQLNVASGKAPVTLLSSDVTGNLPVDVQTIKTQAVTCGASVTVLANVGTSSASTAQTGDSFARIGFQGSGLSSVTVATNNDKTGYSLSSVGVQAIWDALTSALTTVGSIGKLLVTNINAALSTLSTYAGGDTSGTTTLLTRIPGTVQPQTGDAFARIGAAGASLTALGDTRIANLDVAVSTRLAPAGTLATVTNLTNAPGAGDFTATMKASITTAATAATPTVSPDPNVALIKAKTDNLPAAPAAVSDIPTANANADALLKRDWTAVTGEAARSVLNALRFLRNKWSVTGGTLTVTKEDDITPAFTGAVSTDAAALPVTGSDPT